MLLKKSELQEFKKIYFKNFGEKISDQKALELATSLVNLYKTIYKSNKKII